MNEHLTIRHWFFVAAYMTVGLLIGLISWRVKRGRYPLLYPVFQPVSAVMRRFGRDTAPTLLGTDTLSEVWSVEVFLWPFHLIWLVMMYLFVPFLAGWLWLTNGSVSRDSRTT